MVKVTVHADTPSESIVKAANSVTIVIDSQNRKIGIKKIGALDRMKMFEAIGPENSKNEAYLGYAALAFSVTSIDDVPQGRPVNKIQLERMIQELGDDGLDAVGAFFEAEAKVKKQADAAAEGESPIKNG